MKRVSHRSMLAVAATLAIVGLSCGEASRMAGPKDPGATPQPANAVEALKLAYVHRDYAAFAALLHPDFRFVLDQPTPGGENSWGRDEELRIHRRMFDPNNIPATEPPLNPELRITAVEASLSVAGELSERSDFYRSATNPSGLDDTHWQCLAGDWNTNVLFRTAGETDYLISGRGYFVIAVDRTKAADDPTRFQLYQWTDLGVHKPGGVAGVEGRTWTDVKILYRN
jgi:hypothetical protein